MRAWVNADDFGWSKTCSDAIFECFQKNFITTTTACSNGEYFRYAVYLIKETPYKNRVGLHVNLTEGKPLTNGIKECKKICDDCGNFIGYPKRYARLSKKEKQMIYLEIKAQFEAFLDSGLSIHHIDSHHHIHNSFRILPIIKKVAKEYSVNSIRVARNVGKINVLKKFYKHFINSSISKIRLTKYMGGVDDLCFLNKKNQESFELMIHPDYDSSGVLIDRTNDDYSHPTGNPLLIEQLVDVLLF